MSRIKSLSRGDWVVVGIVIVLILVPSGVAIATVAHQTSVTDAPLPAAMLKNYTEYGIEVFPNPPGGQCKSAARIPPGKAFVAQQVDVAVFATQAPIAQNGYNLDSSGEFQLSASKRSANLCSGKTTMASGEAPDGTVGNVAIPLVPGYVVPSGYSIGVYTIGMGATVWITGYLVRSADAPTTPR